MADITELKAQPRDMTGSSASRAIRKAGGVPAIVYGGRGGPEMLTLNYREVWKQVETGQFLSTVFMLDVGGKKTRVIPRDVQFDPVRDFVEHVDFMRLRRTSRINLYIHVEFVNHETAPGLKDPALIRAFIEAAREVARSVSPAAVPS